MLEKEYVCSRKINSTKSIKGTSFKIMKYSFESKNMDKNFPQNSVPKYNAFFLKC